jgi:hypothetical protein
MRRFSVGWLVGISMLNLLGTGLLGALAILARIDHGGSDGIEFVLLIWTQG